jgi:hypothetical protein
MPGPCTAPWRARKYRPVPYTFKSEVDAAKAVAQYTACANAWDAIEAKGPSCDWKEACYLVGGKDLLRRTGAPVGFGKYASTVSSTVVTQAPEYLRWCCQQPCPNRAVVALLELGTSMLEARLEYERMMQELRDRDERRVRFRKAVWAVVACLRLRATLERR